MTNKCELLTLHNWINCFVIVRWLVLAEGNGIKVLRTLTSHQYGLVSMPGDGLVWSWFLSLFWARRFLLKVPHWPAPLNSNLIDFFRALIKSGWLNKLHYIFSFYQAHASCTTKMNKLREVLFKISCQRNSPWQTQKLCILHIILCNWYLG